MRKEASWIITRVTGRAIPLLLIFLAAALQTPSTFAVQQPDLASQYYELGLQATNWITSFQVTPLNASWGIPYQNQRTWGLDPFYFDNGTITAGTNGIIAGQRQTLAFLIAGHDAGLGFRVESDLRRPPSLLNHNDFFLRHIVSTLKNQNISPRRHH